MNASLVSRYIAVTLLAATAAVATVAMASEEASKFNDKAATSATRSEVQAEAAVARRNGTAFKDGDGTTVVMPSGAGSVKRETTQSEARQLAKSKTQRTRTLGSYYGS
ncbi:MAG: hypothetical protein JWQ11_4078 [Rhizobacter sp.]|nr:hypothetical protein [Rhizobacter sp.]